MEIKDPLPNYQFEQKPCFEIENKSCLDHNYFQFQNKVRNNKNKNRNFTSKKKNTTFALTCCRNLMPALTFLMYLRQNDRQCTGKYHTEKSSSKQVQIKSHDLNKLCLLYVKFGRMSSK